MKTKSLLTSIVLTVLLFAFLGVANAQESISKDEIDNSSLLISLPATNVDSVTSASTHVVTEWFTLGEYDDDSWSTYPVTYTKLYTSADGKPYITLTLETSNDQTHITVADTLGGVQDSLETLYKGTLSISCAKQAYWRLKAVGESKSTTLKNRADALFQVEMLFPKKRGY